MTRWSDDSDGDHAYDPPVTLELVPLATARVGLRPGISLPNTPQGTRMIVEVTSFDIHNFVPVLPRAKSPRRDILLSSESQEC